MIIVRSSRVLYRWLLPVVFGALSYRSSNHCGVSAELFSTEIQMMGIMVPETC